MILTTQRESILRESSTNSEREREPLVRPQNPKRAWLALTIVLCVTASASHLRGQVGFGEVILPNPVWDDLVIVSRHETYDLGADQIFAGFIADAATDHLGVLEDETSGGSIFRFPTVRTRDDFLDLMESTERVQTGLATRYRDIVDYASIMGFGGTLNSESGGSPYVVLPPNDTLYPFQCNLDSVRVIDSWALLPPSLPTVTIAIIDSGIDETHIDLQGRITDNGANYTPLAGGANVDPLDHGTRVAGLIVAITDNFEGIAGCAPTPPSGVPILKAMSQRTYKSSPDNTLTGSIIAGAIDDAVTNGASVINMSIGLSPTIDKTAISRAIDDAIDAGVVLVAAAGNKNSVSIDYPASDPDVIAVGTVNCDNYREFSSNYGNLVDVAAPGVQLRSTGVNNTYPIVALSSYAAAHVSALAGLVKAVLPFGSAQQVRAMIVDDDNTELAQPELDGSQPFKHGVIDFFNTMVDAVNAGPGGPPAPGLTNQDPWKVKAKSPYAESLYFVDGLPTSPPGGVQLVLKDDDNQASALLAMAAYDQESFVAHSVLTNKKEQTTFNCRFAVQSVPSANLTLRLRGSLDSDDDNKREIAVQFYNYAQKKWGVPMYVTVFDNGQDFDESFVLNTFLDDHIKSPQGWMRCKITARHKLASSKAVPFRLAVNRLKLTVN